MARYKLRTDRVVDSTDNNEFADGTRDETMIDEYITEEVPLDDLIPGSVNEEREGPRPLYNESGVEDDVI